jgi:hypothetical protein
MKREVEDWLTELPPLDGNDDDAAVDVDVADDIEPGVEHDSLDDAAADTLDISEDDTDAVEAEAEEGDEEWSADIGDPELDLTGDEPAEDDDAGPDERTPDGGGDEVDVDGEDERAPADDPGDEGPNEPVEHALDQELPAIDADDEGDFEEALVADALGALEMADDHDRRAAPRWADTVWSDDVRRSRALTWCSDDDDPCVDVCSHGPSAVLAVTAGGHVWAADGERIVDTTYAALQALAGGPLERPLAVAMGTRGAWLFDRSGRLFHSADAGLTWEARAGADRRPIAGTARDSAALLLVAEGPDARMLTSADGVTWFAEHLGVVLQSGLDGKPWIVACGAGIAVGDAGGVWLARDGKRFERVEGSQGATAGAFLGSQGDAPFVFAVPAYGRDGGTHLVRVDDVGGRELVAHLARRAAMGDDDEELLPLHLHWDAEHHSLHVAFSSVIVACVVPATSREASPG